MNGVGGVPTERGLYPRVSVAQFGPWWTLDAASLRVPARDGHYVEIWSVGSGPSVLLVPPAAGHGYWVPALESLQEAYTLHAMERRAAPPPGSHELSREAEIRDVRLAAWAVGAVAVVAFSDAMRLIAGALRPPTSLQAAILCAASDAGDVPGVDDLGVPALRVEAVDVQHGVTERLGRDICSALDRLLCAEGTTVATP